jgi:hypothetical protein
VWVHPEGGEGSVALAQTLHRALGTLGVPDHGIKAADMGVLRPQHLAPGAAACLLEVDFLSHPEGERRLRDPASLARLGHAIADGVRTFLAAGLDLTENSSQDEQTNAVLGRIVGSIQTAEGASVDQDVVRSSLDAVASSGKYPYIDGYMNGISEVAAHVLAHAARQFSPVDDLIATVVARHGGDDALGREMVQGTITETKLLLELGAEVARRVPGVGRRYRDLVDQYDATGLSYFFHPQARSGADPSVDVEEIKFGLQGESPTRTARLERVGDQATLVFDWLGQARRVPLGVITEAPRYTPPAGYEIAVGGKGTLFASIVSYILTYACSKWGKPLGTEIPFEVDGKRWVGKFTIHNDGPGGPKPYDHASCNLYTNRPGPVRLRPQPTPGHAVLHSRHRPHRRVVDRD